MIINENINYQTEKQIFIFIYYLILKQINVNKNLLINFLIRNNSIDININ